MVPVNTQQLPAKFGHTVYVPYRLPDLVVPEVAKAKPHCIDQSTVAGPAHKNLSGLVRLPKVAVEVVIGPIAPLPAFLIRLKTKTDGHDDQITVHLLAMRVPCQLGFIVQVHVDVAHAPMMLDSGTFGSQDILPPIL